MKVSALRGVEKKYKGRTEPVEELVAGLKAVKESGEVEAIRAALALSEGILTDMLVRLEPGMPEREAAALFEYEFKRRGASGASFDTIALFGPRSSLPHGAPGDTPLEPGDTVLFDFGCRLNGYCSDLTRTCCFATIPGPWFAEVYDLTLTAQRLAIEAARPGMGCRELDSVARKLIADAGHGEHFGHGLGHGVGIEIHESPRLNPHSDTVLEPGMVVTVEPGIYLPGRGGVRIEDVIVITEDGCEVLSTFPKELRILEA
jgi:Xaa-Pro aminopeptidase